MTRGDAPEEKQGGNTMKKTILKKLVTLAVALVMLVVCAVPAFAANGKTQKGNADSDSLIERIQHDDLQGMTDDAVMMASPHVKNLAFLIEDCGYADLKGTMKDICDSYLKFVDFDNFYEAANRYATVGDVNYDSVKPINAIRALDPSVPALFLHGEGDTYIAPKNVKKLYKAKRGIREMKTFPLAGHSQSYFFDIPGYTECVTNFLANYVNK